MKQTTLFHNSSNDNPLPFKQMATIRLLLLFGANEVLLDDFQIKKFLAYLKQPADVEPVIKELFFNLFQTHYNYERALENLTSFLKIGKN